MEIKYIREEIEEALRIVSSVISRCEKTQPKFAEGTSHHTLLKNRIKAMYISKSLIKEDSEIDRYSKEELISALKPVASVISKCETGQRKHEIEDPQYKRFEKIIDAMKIANSLIEDEISKRG
jgi:predicted transcriptional regulator